MITENQKTLIQQQIVPVAAQQIGIWLKGVTRDNTSDLARTHLSIEHVVEKVAVIARYLPDGIGAQSRVLEIGTGFGAFANYTRALYGWKVFGCEPEQAALECARHLGEILGSSPGHLTNNIGEQLPFADASFDLVYSSNVLEHVQDPDRVLAEAIRVAKPGGHVFFTFPNYGSWWEGHYGIPWIPRLTKWLARIYVRLYGRDPGYIDTLQLLDIPNVQRRLSRVADRVTLITLGEDLWEERLRTMSFGTWGSTARLKRIIEPLKRLGLIRLAIAVGKLAHWHYPIIMVLQKK